MRLAPFMETKAEMDELFDRMMNGGSRLTMMRGNHEVPTDVFHTEEGLVIRMDLPGVDASSVDVTVQDNVLVINGTRGFPYEGDKVRFLRRGAFYGDFTQRVVLGKGLKLDEIRASFDSGVLELKVPFAEEIQPRKIDIEVGNGSKQLTE